MKTKGEIEAAISEAIVHFEIDYMGRGPKEARSHIVEDLILVRLKGMLTPAEQQLAKTPEGVELIKKMRSTIIDNAKAEFSRVITNATGVAVRDILTDISTASGERIFVFILDRNLGKELPRRISP
ncbi:MAG: DUF2294 domain-containing protein [Deltaproteobacteria bacterium]|jgi:uncharacterized protein YbcI|nr:MAG: DUF2294 domain-containing protein [Deltaproteobacteria bacterium]